MVFVIELKDGYFENCNFSKKSLSNIFDKYGIAGQVKPTGK